jgi:NAD(P)-dependent dehydrogenase (short-subunit alcohol dehydrogenase family)
VALYSSDEGAARELVDTMAESKMQGLVLRHDVRSEEMSIWNHPEIQGAESLTLVNNACAAFSPKPMHLLRWEDFENNFQTAVKGAWHCSQSLIRLMLKTGHGSIVNILTSAVEEAPPKGFAAYVTAKHALRGFTLALAAEYGARGLKVFSVSPGYMETSLTQQWDPQLREAIRANAGRITVPDEAAARIVALVGNDATPGRGENYSV